MSELVITSKNELVEIIKSIITPFFAQQQQQPEPEKPPIYLSRKEVAQMLKISLPTLQKHTESGLLPHHYIGRRVLYDQNELVKVFDNAKTIIVQKNKYKRA